jgi:2'-5' RNA ligase
MKQRIFIAINLEEKDKNFLAGYSEKFQDLPAKWTKKENIHITLEFLGYLTAESIAGVYKTIEEISAKHNPFTIELNKICYAPPDKMPPKMIWATGNKSEELNLLKKDLQKALVERGLIIEETEKTFIPHITLARIRAWDFRKIEPEERPEINEDISFSLGVNSIELMESKLKKGGPEYFVLESCRLNN